jgi:hypothetical protein
MRTYSSQKFIRTRLDSRTKTHISRNRVARSTFESLQEYYTEDQLLLGRTFSLFSVKMHLMVRHCPHIDAWDLLCGTTMLIAATVHPHRWQALLHLEESFQRRGHQVRSPCQILSRWQVLEVSADYFKDCAVSGTAIEGQERLTRLRQIDTELLWRRDMACCSHNNLVCIHSPQCINTLNNELPNARQGSS